MSGFSIHNVADNAEGLTCNGWTFAHQGTPRGDYFLHETPDYVYGLEGTVLNASALCTTYGKGSLKEVVAYLWAKKDSSLPDAFYGDFTLFIFEKQASQLHFYTNQTGTNQVFFAQLGTQLMISSSLFDLHARGRRHGWTFSHDITALYAMMTYGCMIHDHTPLQEVKRLQAGEKLTFSTETAVRIERYHDYNAICYVQRSEKETLQQLNELFTQAVATEYQKDAENDAKSVATLSGGLDSRMNVMVAHQMGSRIEKAFCFSEPDYADVHIAKKIAADLGIPFSFLPLNGDYILDIDENTRVSNGCILYVGSAHLRQSLLRCWQPEYGLIHTGQLGDGILGGFVSSPRSNQATLAAKCLTNAFLPRIQAEYTSHLAQYANEETYKLYNRVFNMTNLGSLVSREFSFLSSPFMHPAVIDFCLSISPEAKFQQKIYLQWMMQFHPQATQYTWENLLVKPNALWKLWWGPYKVRSRNAWYKKVRGTDRHTTMNPYGYWMAQQPALKQGLDDYVKNNEAQLTIDSALHRDAMQLYRDGTLMQKATVITNIATLTQLQQA